MVGLARLPSGGQAAAHGVCWYALIFLRPCADYEPVNHFGAVRALFAVHDILSNQKLLLSWIAFQKCLPADTVPLLLQYTYIKEDEMSRPQVLMRRAGQLW